MANTKITSRVIADNSVGIDALNVTDGTNGQALVTDGSGGLSFASVGVSGIDSSADATAITIDSSENVTFTGSGTFGSNVTALTSFNSTTGNDLRLNAGSVNRDISMQVNGSTLMTVQGSTGRVGIGTNNPGADLHISLVNAKIKLGSYSFITEDIEDNDSLGLWAHTTESIYFGQTSDNLTSRNITCRIDPDGILRPTRFRVPASALPTSAVSTGDLHLDTGDSNTLKVYNGTQWIEISSTSVQASGGTTTTYGGYKSHTFTSSGTFTVTAGGSIDVMLVAGGGGGSQDTAGGGGAGGMLISQSINVVAQSYTITIGAGGAQANGSRGNDGNDTTAFGLTAIAGGGGAGSAGGSAPAGNGGSGGGGGGGKAAGSGTTGQGFAGETSSGAAGGGGAGEAGGTDGVGYGGDGLQNNYRTGSNIYYAGGGGGRAGSTGYPGGDGGGGNGPSGNSGLGAGNAAYAGTANTGGGGAAYSGAWNGAGPGGSGIVVIRYPA